MKSAMKLYKDDISDFYDFLIRKSCEVNTETVDWRVMMYRAKGQTQWTQLYDGLTQNAKVSRDFLRAFGPDQNLIDQFYNGRGNIEVTQ